MDIANEAALKRAVGMLDATLTRQTELHRSMLEVAERKRQSIIAGNLEELEKSVAEEKKLVTSIEEEEQKRLAIMPLVKRGLGLTEEADKLKDLIEKLPEPERGKMNKTRVELKEVIEECRKKTRHNAELLKASLEHVNSFLKAVNEAAHPDATYGKDGRRSHGGPSLLDRNA